MKKIKNWFTNLFRIDHSTRIQSDLDRFIAQKQIADVYMLDYWIKEWNRTLNHKNYKGWNY
jgi:hypothetical protein